MSVEKITEQPVAEKMNTSAYALIVDTDNTGKKVFRHVPKDLFKKFLDINKLEKTVDLIPVGNGDSYAIGMENSISASIINASGEMEDVDSEYAYCAYYTGLNAFVGETLYVSGACRQTAPLYVFKDADGVIIDMGWGNGEEELTVVENCEVTVPEGAELMYINQLRRNEFTPCVTGYFKKVEIGEDNLSEDLAKKINEAEQPTNKNKANGYAGLDENGKILKANLDLYVKTDDTYKAVSLNEYDGVSGSQASVTADIWIEAIKNYEIPYIIKGKAGSNMVLLPKLSTTTTKFDESDSTLWSTASGMYYFAKIDVSMIVGRSVKIYGRSQATAYPLAFSVSEDGTILERYGMDAYNVYGYEQPAELSGITYTWNVEPLIATIPENAKYIYIQGGFFTSSGVIIRDCLPKIEVCVENFVANETYKLMQSPLFGKKLYVDGDSICYGNGYNGGFGKIIADRYNMKLVNNGVGGATICSGVCNNVAYGTEMDWENNTYYLKLSGFDVLANKSVDGFAYPITKSEYDNGFGIYPTTYKLVNGEIVEQEYSETMPTGTFFVKFNLPTYDGNTVEKYYRMWSANNWLWDAYKNGFAGVHESGSAEIATARHWLSTSVNDVDTDADYIIFEGGINDYLMNRRIGELSEDMTSAVDITTVIGGMEHICRVLLKKCIGKKIIYVITPKAKNYAHLANSNAAGNKTWTDYHDAILSVLRKYSIPCVDLFNNSAFNTEIEEYLAYTERNDGVHPNYDGYKLFYVPQIVSGMESI